MNSKNSTARLAGFMYLLLVITGIFYLLYVPSTLIDWTSAENTTNNIMASEFLFRAGIVAGIISSICFLILPFILYELFKSVNKTYAVLMVIFAVVSIPISIFNMVNKVDVLTLLSGAQYLDALAIEQLHTQVMLLLKSYNNGLAVVQIFWGLWIFPLAYLVFNSGFIPKIFGVLLMMVFVKYMILFFHHFLFPTVELPGFIGLIGLSEIVFCFWLLFMGVKNEQAKDIVD